MGAVAVEYTSPLSWGRSARETAATAVIAVFYGQFLSFVSVENTLHEDVLFIHSDSK